MVNLPAPHFSATFGLARLKRLSPESQEPAGNTLLAAVGAEGADPNESDLPAVALAFILPLVWVVAEYGPLLNPIPMLVGECARQAPTSENTDLLLMRADALTTRNKISRRN